MCQEMPQTLVYACGAVGFAGALTVCFVHPFHARVLVQVVSEGAISPGIHRIRWKHGDRNRFVDLC